MSNVQPLTPEDPRRLGAYELIGRLGEGGQGVVYLGRGSVDSVAVKLLHSQLMEDEAARARFVREVEVAKRVARFSTAQVLHAGMTGDRPYIVTEYVPGPSLFQLVKRDGPRRGAALERLAVNTATALAAIHQAGVVHRDFKPGNVLMGPDGPVVIDFGIARALDMSGSAAGITSQVVGTPAYMAPEQLDEGEIGPPADLFAWAITIVYAATGTPAFGNQSIPKVINRILHDQPDLGPLDGRLRQLTTAALSKNPTHRPTARHLIDALTGNSTTPWPNPPSKKQQRTDKSNDTPQPDAPAQPHALAPGSLASGGEAPQPGMPGSSGEASQPGALAPGGGGTSQPGMPGPASGDGTARPGALAPGGLASGGGGDASQPGMPGSHGGASQPGTAASGGGASSVWSGATAFDVSVGVGAPRSDGRVPGGSANGTLPGGTLPGGVSAGVRGPEATGVDAGVSADAPTWVAGPPTGGTLVGVGQPDGRRRGVIVGAVLAVVLVAAGGIAFAATRGGSHDPGSRQVIGSGPQGAKRRGPGHGHGSQDVTRKPTPKASHTKQHPPKKKKKKVKASPYNAAGVCGAGYRVVDSHPIGAATAYLLYNSSAGANCTLTMLPRSTGRVPLGATLRVKNGRTGSDNGTYEFYAGPVRLPARGRCVQWGGTYNTAQWTSPWTHCT